MTRCDYHRGPSGSTRLVFLQERVSASPIVRYACAPCREQRWLRPVDNIDNLARIRAHATGESLEEARVALEGETPAPAGP